MLPTLKTEVTRLDEMKNCDYHRAKLATIVGDFNKCVDENIALSQKNQHLTQKKKTLETKLDVVTRRLEEFINLTPIMHE